MVGAAVLLDFLTSFLRAFDYPGGRLWLVNDQLQVLAASDGREPRRARPAARWPTCCRRSCARSSRRSCCAPAQGFRELGGVHVLAQQVGTTPWTLLYVISPAELNAVILPRLVPYGIILAGLVLTLLPRPMPSASA